MNEREIIRMVHRRVDKLRRSGELRAAPIGDFKCEECGDLFKPTTRKNNHGNRVRFCSTECWNGYQRGRPKAEWAA